MVNMALFMVGVIAYGCAATQSPGLEVPSDAKPSQSSCEDPCLEEGSNIVEKG